jgi:phosphate:Na+ symporter
LIAELLGGIGLFLLGMMLMTDGLEESAGEGLQALLKRATGNRLKGSLFGATLTLVVQSSTASTLATIGFVSAGLLTFYESLAVIVGTNVGTTSTGWLVSLIGLRISVSSFALPLVGIGALLRMLARGRLAALGFVLAGFGLIFIGIDLLQAGMADVADDIDLGGLDGGMFLTRLALVAIGVIMTVLMQSSSAALATTLAALASGAIALPAALALVVGQNIGTTVLASLGGTVPAKRTAAAHVLFNVAAAIVVFPFLPVVPDIAEAAGIDDPAVTVAAFHTSFSVIGALIFLPLLHRIGTLILRIVPEQHVSLTRDLDTTVTTIPAVAVVAAHRTMLRVTGVGFDVAGRRLVGDAESAPPDLDEVNRALADVRIFLASVRSWPDHDHSYDRHLSVLHAIDHADRFVELVAETGHLDAAARDPELRAMRDELGEWLASAARWCASESETAPYGTTADVTPSVSPQIGPGPIEARSDEHRATTLARAAQGQCTPEEAATAIAAMRWLERLSLHSARSVYHLEREPHPTDEDEAAPSAAS